MGTIEIEYRGMYWKFERPDDYTECLIAFLDTEDKYMPDNEKPWRDPESLYCDKDFLKELTGKEPL